MLKAKHKPIYRPGFTLVELLIVIVVIAILAAITIVSYGNVSRRAYNAQVISAVAQWDNVIRVYKINGGDISVLGIEGTCLTKNATDFPAGNGFSAGVCGGGMAAVQNTSNTLASTSGLNLPVTIFQPINANGTSYRGIFAYYWDTIVYLVYYLYGNSCISTDTGTVAGVAIACTRVI